MYNFFADGNHIYLYSPERSCVWNENTKEVTGFYDNMEDGFTGVFETYEQAKEAFEIHCDMEEL